MSDPGSARDVNEAAWRFAETLADSYGLVYEQAEGSAEADAFPIEGYDRMNVEEISSRLGGPRGGAAAGSRPRGTPRGAHNAARANGPQDKGFLLGQAPKAKPLTIADSGKEHA
jgi:hypothetical protein